jgi:hypothetical protein
VVVERRSQEYLVGRRSEWIPVVDKGNCSIVVVVVVMPGKRSLR